MNPCSCKKVCLSLLFLGVVWAPAIAQIQTQNQTSRLQDGISLYGRGLWLEAVIELRRYQAEAPDAAHWAEALYWIALSELGAGEYEAAIRDMDELERITLGTNPRYAEIPYHRGRAYYYLGRYDEALVILKAYTDSLTFETPEDETRMPAALYWIGESLYSLGQLDAAQNIFMIIINDYPYSVKYEAASYRAALINQKKIEAELLSLLKWTHEESLKTVEEYQRRERSYDQAIIAYQKRIADMLKENHLSDLENANADYQRRLEEAEARIGLLETQLREANAPVPSGRTDLRAESSPDAGMSRIYSLKNSAQDMVNELLNAGTGAVKRDSAGGEGK
ncbi:MAG: tetratricopeptide repeat protein [Treponema sp.]|jgi:tetratricopeptide (TPR) repeat protein|nr:tetratricopeptide repeat protein [Treponema sp.]